MPRKPDEILHRGVKLSEIFAAHAKWRREDSDGERAYLTRANLADANLADAYLTRAYLADANLAGANLAGANLARANLAGAYLTRANLARAYLTRANLAGAYLAGANLAGAIGNMREIKSAHFETWTCNWTMSPEGEAWLQIGCQRHAVEKWRRGCERWIAQMDEDASDWWARYRDPLLALVDASPATPWGKPQMEGK